MDSVQYCKGGEEMNYLIGDKVYYKGIRVTIINIDDDIESVKIITDDGWQRWVKKSEVTA
jgi:hypothetical protein